MRYPLIHVHQRCAADPTARDTISIVAGVSIADADALLDAVAHVVAELANVDRYLLRAAMSWHVEGECVCGPVRIHDAARLVADDVIRLMTGAKAA